ncbi:MAG: DNA repair protein RecO [Candidatus Omnitrophica bacterium]|nr:DNA repair protein RecO [Candidatus Omnitrophota bacterium]
MAIQKTEALVLKKFDFRDTSLIVTLFTRDFGKMKVVVKGVRKEGSSDLVHFEVLNHIDIVFYEKARAELHLLSESFLIDPILELRNSFRTYTFGCYLAELVDALFEIHEPSPKIFDFLLETLKRITSRNISCEVLKFELGILKAAGLSPGINACVRCAKSSDSRWSWSPRQGGLLCGACAIREAKIFPVSAESFEVMQNPGFYQADHGVYKDVEQLVREFIRARVEYPIRSAEFLSSTDSFKAGLAVKASRIAGEV